MPLGIMVETRWYRFTRGYVFCSVCAGELVPPKAACMCQPCGEEFSNLCRDCCEKWRSQARCDSCRTWLSYGDVALCGFSKRAWNSAESYETCERCVKVGARRCKRCCAAARVQEDADLGTLEPGRVLEICERLKTIIEVPGCREYVYLMRSGDYCKIGMTTKGVEQRRRDLQHGNPMALVLVAALPFEGRPMELRLHQEFAHRRMRKNGEWFLWSKEIQKRFDVLRSRWALEYAKQIVWEEVQRRR